MNRIWLTFPVLAVLIGAAAVLLTLPDRPSRTTGPAESAYRRSQLPARSELSPPSTVAPVPARVVLPASVPEFEKSDPPAKSGRSLRGAVQDRNGAPVSGVLICALWSREDEFGFEDRAWNSELDPLYAALLDGRSHPNRELVHMRTARTKDDGTYEIDGLPAVLRTVWPILKWHHFENTISCDYCNAETLSWCVEPLHSLAVDCEFPDGSSHPGTRVVLWRSADLQYPWPSHGMPTHLRLVAGQYKVSARNDSFGYVSAPVQCDVGAKPQALRLIMERVPRLEIAVAFEGASLHSEYGVVIQSADGKEWSGACYHPLAGIWAASDLDHGAYEARVTCDGDTLCSVPVQYNGGVQRIEMRVREPKPGDCCILRTTASHPLPGQKLSVVRHGAAMVIWLREEGEWLLQPGRSEVPKPGEPTSLHIMHEGWGRLTVAASGDPGSTAYAEFQRPARLKVPVRDLPNRRAGLTLQVRREDGFVERLDWIDESGVALQPGVWTLEPLGGGSFAHLLPATLELKPGEVHTHTISFSDLRGVCIVRPETSTITSVCFRGPYDLELKLNAEHTIRYLERGLWNIEYVTRYGLCQKFEIDLQAPYRLDLPD
ncbi:MAG: hypothetical protein IT464_03265 [Planctomycetes bacterium]|nr:hypothetical protein [Planctomycetota bacterium]